MATAEEKDFIKYAGVTNPVMNIHALAYLHLPGSLLFQGKVKVKSKDGMFRRWRKRFLDLRFPYYLCFADDDRLENPTSYSLINYREIKLKSVIRRGQIKRKYLKITLVSVYPDMEDIKLQCTSLDQYLTLKNILSLLFEINDFQQQQNERTMANIAARRAPTNEGAPNSNDYTTLPSSGSTSDDKANDAVETSVSPRCEIGNRVDLSVNPSQVSVVAALEEMSSAFNKASPCASDTNWKVPTQSQMSIVVLAVQFLNDWTLESSDLLMSPSSSQGSVISLDTTDSLSWSNDVSVCSQQSEEQATADKAVQTDFDDDWAAIDDSADFEDISFDQAQESDVEDGEEDIVSRDVTCTSAINGWYGRMVNAVRGLFRGTRG